MSDILTTMLIVIGMPIAMLLWASAAVAVYAAWDMWRGRR